MILHIFSDEKFVDLAVDQFNSVDKANNKYVILCEANQENKNFYNHNASNLSFVNENSKQYVDLIESVCDYSAVFIHYLDELKCRFIEKLDYKTRLAWFFWGQDAQKLFCRNSYLKRTYIQLLRLGLYKELLWPVYYTLLNKKIKKSKKVKIIRRFECCAPVIKEELELLREKLDIKNLKYLDFNYGAIEDNLKDCLNEEIKSEDYILIGNSSTFASNHVDSLNLIKNKFIGGRKILLPLNYGNASYADLVEKHACKIFGKKNVKTLRNFLNREEYFKILNTCDIAIMNHLRQQALGTIQILLWKGAAIYMNKRSILYKTLIAKGFKIFSTQQLKKEKVTNKLSNDDKKANKKLILKYYSRDVILNKTEKIVKLFE